MGDFIPIKPRYYDILKIIGKEPIWWDERGVPRFESFDPHLHISPFANECVLIKSECQCCRAPYLVSMSSSKKSYLAQAILKGNLNYGDPPRGCFTGGSQTKFLTVINPSLKKCGVGASTTLDIKNVLEFWRRSGDLPPKWIEDSSYRNFDIPCPS